MGAGCSRVDVAPRRVTTLNSEEACNFAINDSPDKMCVFFFHARWCSGCMKIERFYHELSDRYKRVNFFKIDVEKKEFHEMLLKMRVDVLPQFWFVFNGATVERLEGIDEGRILDLVQKYSRRATAAKRRQSLADMIDVGSTSGRRPTSSQGNSAVPHSLGSAGSAGSSDEVMKAAAAGLVAGNGLANSLGTANGNNAAPNSVNGPGGQNDLTVEVNGATGEESDIKARQVQRGSANTDGSEAVSHVHLSGSNSPTYSGTRYFTSSPVHMSPSTKSSSGGKIELPDPDKDAAMLIRPTPLKTLTRSFGEETVRIPPDVDMDSIANNLMAGEGKGIMLRERVLSNTRNGVGPRVSKPVFIEEVSSDEEGSS